MGILPLLPNRPEFSIDRQKFSSRCEPDRQRALKGYAQISPQWVSPRSFFGDFGEFAVHFRRNVEIRAVVIFAKQFLNSRPLLRRIKSGSREVVSFHRLLPDFPHRKIQIAISLQPSRRPSIIPDSSVFPG